MIDENLLHAEEKMGNAIDHLRKELGKLRSGRASLALLEDIKANYYGTATPLAQVATLSVPDSQTISIQPWEASLLKEIEKSIQNSDLGLTPSNDGKMIRLTVPQLTGERRQQLGKIVKKIAEETRVSIRNARREFNEKLKQLEKDSVSKDDCKRAHDQVQKITDAQIREVDKISQAKEKDILEN